NPVAYLIPCHRVIRATALSGGYRWGAARKLAMLARERAAHDRDLRPGA
ncbi:MAG: MGMT family protein, partial [Hyphomicrobiales bacterium]